MPHYTGNKACHSQELLPFDTYTELNCNRYRNCETRLTARPMLRKEIQRQTNNRLHSDSLGA